MFGKNTFLFVVLLSVMSIFNLPLLQAQTPEPPLSSYFCDFESNLENAEWVLNPSVADVEGDFKNWWFINRVGANEGKGGLFISSDGKGKIADYKSSPNCIVAYREMTLEAGEYTLSFDWRAIGMSLLNTNGEITKGDALYVCWVPSPLLDVDGNETSIYSRPSTATLQPWVLPNALVFNPGEIGLNSDKALRGSNWTTANVNLVSDGTPHKLVFVWNNSTLINCPPSACVDNIFMAKKNNCGLPSYLRLNQNGTSFDLLWKGTGADSYEVRMCTGNNNWIYYNNLVPNGNATTPEKLTFSDLEEGVVYIYVRGKCGDAYSPWVSMFKFVFYDRGRCIEYLFLDDSNCKIGIHGIPVLTDYKKEDYGYFSRKSRHTLHFVENERDPRTISGVDGLYTVPKGEIASVRLGNWAVGGEAEEVEYEFVVDAESAAVLLLQYAVVLQEPANSHETFNMPSFKLQIQKKVANTWADLDEEGCGKASFTVGAETSDWKQGFYDDQLKAKVLWKDWTIVGINLADYHGQTLRAKLYTSDCGEKGHYGYAYFTIACSDGKVQGLSCGSDNKALAAPEGFKYRWYNPNNPDITLSEDRIFDISKLYPGDQEGLENDTNTYACDVIQITNVNCYYTIYASARARSPQAKFSYKAKIENCDNIVDFRSVSKVMVYNPETDEFEESEDDEIQNTYWDFGDGTEIVTDTAPSYIFPPEGGTFTVKLKVGISDDKCLDSVLFDITLPDIRVRESSKTVYCSETKLPYIHNEKPYWSSTVVIDTLINPNIPTCDSLVRLNIVVVKSDTTFELVVCDDRYEWYGQILTESGVYSATIPSSFEGVDSTITLDSFIINKPLLIDIAKEYNHCEDDDTLMIQYTILDGIMGTYDVVFDDPKYASLNRKGIIPRNNKFAISTRNTEIELIPNVYKTTLILENVGCDTVELDVLIKVAYSDTKVLSQRWNDVIGVKNYDHNGNYDFYEFQWYKGDDKIEGATLPNLYVQPGLEIGAQYKVELTRKSDNVKLLTCPITIRDLSSTPNIPGNITFSSTTKSISISVTENAIVKIWNVAGSLVGTRKIVAGENNFAAPKNPGVYMLEVIYNDGENSEIHKIVVN